MKLKNIIAPIQQNLRKTVSLLRFNPLTEQGRRGIANSLFNRGRRQLENLEIPQNKSTSTFNREVLDQTQDYIFSPLPNLYPQYDKCDRNNPLGCDRPLATLKKAPSAKFCSQCGFPAQLSENKAIRGRRGTYQITRFLRRQGNGRIYTATQQNNGQFIIIKEYLLPRRSFPSETTREQKKAIFERTVNFQVAATIPSDFRLILPQEGIQDSNQDRCYLITANNLAALPNLKTYLAQQGRMEQEQVLQLLDQVLQSLDFLHCHRWQFTSGEIQQGLVHGNLSLDSLLIRQTEVEFLVYLWDLSCWEDLFNPELEIIPEKRVSDDLAALGNIGLYLLVAKEIVSKNSYPLEPRDDINWQGIPAPIKNFLLRLIGLNSPFKDAATARKELRKLRQDSAILESIPETDLDTADSETNKIIWLPWVIFSAILLLLGWLAWRWLKPTPPPRKSLNVVCCIENIKKVPVSKNSLIYGIVNSENLQDIFKIDFYENNNSTYLAFAKKDAEIEIQPADAQDFISIFREKQQLNFTSPKPFEEFESQQDLINGIEPQKISFALTYIYPLDKYRIKFDRTLDDEQIINRKIAYNGILVYVALKPPCTDCAEIGEYLQQKITLKELQNIYLGKINYWHEIERDNPDFPNNIKIKLFAPNDTYAHKVFKELVFKNEAKKMREFDKAIASNQIKQDSSFSILNQIRDISKAENTADGTKIAGIGFDFLPMAYKQCNVYPLAVVEDSEEFYPMLIKREDNRGVNLFEDVNCKSQKNSYQINEEVFRNGKYPLAFSLNLLYLNNNKNQHLERGNKINEIFQTKEFQCHLSHKKLIPLKLSETDCK